MIKLPYGVDEIVMIPCKVAGVHLEGDELQYLLVLPEDKTAWNSRDRILVDINDIYKSGKYIITERPEE